MPFTALFLFLFHATDSTINPIPYCIRQAASFKWSNYEVAISEKFKDSCLETFRGLYVNSTYKPESKLPKKFTQCFHFVNLNGDKNIDLIYEGNAGSEGSYVTFYLNTGKQLEGIETQNGYVWDLKFKENKLSSFVIYNPGCCAETIEFERHYNVSPLFKCKLEWQVSIIQGMNKFEPDSFFQKPFQFQTLNEDYSLRYEPRISDQVPNEISEGARGPYHGNSTALYPKGSIGTAWATKKDSTGREWWLVEMEPLKYLKFDAYYSLDDFPTRYIGWMSSRFVKKLDQ